MNSNINSKISRIEEGKKTDINFKKLLAFFDVNNSKDKRSYIIPVVVQDIQSKDVLLVAYANRESLEYTIKNKIVAFWEHLPK